MGKLRSEDSSIKKYKEITIFNNSPIPISSVSPLAPRALQKRGRAVILSFSKLGPGALIRQNGRGQIFPVARPASLLDGL